MVDNEGIGLAGSFAGVFMRTMLGYIKARNEAEQVDPNNKLEFDRKFIITAIMSAGGAAAAAILAFPTLIGQFPADASRLAIFAMSFGFGWFANDGINMLVNVGQNTIRASKETIAELREHLIAQKAADKEKKV